MINPLFLAHMLLLIHQIPTTLSFSLSTISSSAFRHGTIKKQFVKSLSSSGITSNRKTFLYNSKVDSNDIATDKVVPITLLSGFLGSGKTTTLKHLLENSDKVKIGVIVNDVASVNIDAKLISSSDLVSNTVELQNGCACCSLADELLTSVEGIIDGRDLDEVVVELSGVADPASVQANWETAASMDHPVTKIANITKIVTLIDACTFGTDYMSWNTADERDGWVDGGDECVGQRKVAELLAEQVEVADMLVVNKVDIATEEQTTVTSSVVKSLNKDASMVEVQYGKIKPQSIFGSDSTDTSDADASSQHQSCCSNPKCSEPDCNDTSPIRSHSRKSSISTKDLGITNFVYKSTRPFHLHRLMSVLNTWPVPIKNELDFSLLNKAVQEGYDTGVADEKKLSAFSGVLRSKGFCWIAPSSFVSNSQQEDDSWRHDTAMFWSHAGRHFGISTAGKWWGTISKEQMKSYFVDNLQEYERIIKQDFVSDEFGDRRQELVFIGLGIDEDYISDELDACLLNDDEMDLYRAEMRDILNDSFTSASTSSNGLFDYNTQNLG